VKQKIAELKQNMTVRKMAKALKMLMSNIRAIIKKFQSTGNVMNLPTCLNALQGG